MRSLDPSPRTTRPLERRPSPSGRSAAKWRLSVAFAACLLLLPVVWTQAAAALVTPGGPWDTATDVRQVPVAITFADARHGWVVGWDGLILATADGGATWSRQQSGTPVKLYGVAFADARHGWVVGSDSYDTGDYGTSVILATADGGTTWEEQGRGLLDGTPRSVACIDPRTAWVAGDTGANGSTFLLGTKDAGATWTDLGSGAGHGWITDVFFLDATHGWALIDGGSDIAATVDGGVTWTTRYSLADGGLRSIVFSDASHGWAVGVVSIKRPTGSGRVGKGVILATSDGGTSWHPQKVMGDWGSWWLDDVAFSDARHGWAVGGFVKALNDSALILTTADGGATWRPQTPPRTWGLSSVAAAGANRAWAVGERVDGVLSADADYGPPILAPTIAGFTPASGPPGTVVIITGSGFQGVKRGVKWVHFDGADAIYKIVSDTRVTAKVPAGATSGVIAMKSGDGAGVTYSNTSFTVE